MFKKLGIVAALALAAGIAFAAIAPAASAEEGRGDVVLRGRGVLDAHGTGVAAVKGRVDMQVNANRGILLVKDIAGDAFVRVDGTGGTAHWNGFTVYFGTGEATIVGSHVAVIMVGTDIDLHAAGKGWAYLKGRGHYFVNGEGPFPWNPDGAFAGVDDGGADPPPEAN
ncbi:MAG: hypothetical protein HY873_05180 [Chloroflexi bacterium]|nr:hypothetical protein [Chloroflexota bacterium]